MFIQFTFHSITPPEAPYHYWWLKNGTVETLAYEFDQPYTVSNVQVYWLDFVELFP